MSDIAIAAVLAGTILLASTVSVEIGLSVALIELFAGVVVGNAFDLDVPSWLALRRLVRRDRAHVPRRRRGRRPAVQARVEGVARRSGSSRSSAPFVVVGLLAYYGLGWNQRPGRDRRDRALDDEPRRRLRRARRDRAEPDRDRQAAHVGDVRHRLRHRARRSRSCSSSRTLWFIAVRASSRSR